jgi:hypothetical protein
MNASTTSPTSVKVSADGVKIGWTILAAGASLGLGLYIATIVTPIKKDLETLTNSLNGCQQSQTNLANTVLAHISESNVKLDNIKQEQKELCNRMKACEHK